MNFWNSSKKIKAFGKKFGGIKLNRVTSTTLTPFGLKPPYRDRNTSKSKKKLKKDLTWNEARKRYPKMNPLGDYDKDGVRNWQDCKPFDKKRQGFQHEYSFGGTAYKKIKTVKMPPELFLKTTYGEVRRRRARQISSRKKLEKGKLPKSPINKKMMDALSKEYEVPYSTYASEFSGRGKPQKDLMITPGVQRDKREQIKKMRSIIKSKSEHLPIPFLTFDDKGKAIGHEGRHTATAAMMEGLKNIPVTIERPKETKLSAKYETLEPIKEKQYQDWAKHHYTPDSYRVYAEDLDDVYDEDELRDKETFVERMRRGKEEAEMRRVMEAKAEERQIEQDSWEEERERELEYKHPELYEDTSQDFKEPEPEDYETEDERREEQQ